MVMLLFLGLFNLLVDQATTNETVQELISPILQVIHDEALKLGSQPLSANSIFSILEHLVANKTIASAITDLPTFSPASLTASTFERDSVLGPLFNISPLHGSRAASLFLLKFCQILAAVDVFLLMVLALIPRKFSIFIRVYE